MAEKSETGMGVDAGELIELWRMGLTGSSIEMVLPIKLRVFGCGQYSCHRDAVKPFRLATRNLQSDFDSAKTGVLLVW
jgi:hypothetical protein